MYTKTDRVLEVHCLLNIRKHADKSDQTNKKYAAKTTSRTENLNKIEE